MRPNAVGVRAPPVRVDRAGRRARWTRFEGMALTFRRVQRTLEARRDWSVGSAGALRGARVRSARSLGTWTTKRAFTRAPSFERSRLAGSSPRRETQSARGNRYAFGIRGNGCPTGDACNHQIGPANATRVAGPVSSAVNADADDRNRGDDRHCGPDVHTALAVRNDHASTQRQSQKDQGTNSGAFHICISAAQLRHGCINARGRVRLTRRGRIRLTRLHVRERPGGVPGDPLKGGLLGGARPINSRTTKTSRHEAVATSNPIVAFIAHECEPNGARQ